MKKQMIETLLEEKLMAQQEVWSGEKGGRCFNLEKPANAQFGDFSTNIAMMLYPRLKMSSQITTGKELAQKIVSVLNDDVEIQEIIEKIEVAGPGFINFYLKLSVKVAELTTCLTECMPEVVKMGKDKLVLVEFSSPNIAKPFTIGHLRSTIIGAALANLLENSGYVVKRDNHLGDWGTQFGKQLVAIEKWSSLEEIEESQEPIKKLVELYVRFHAEAERNPALENEAREIFAKLEKGDKKYLTIWHKIIELSMKEFDSIYKRLCVQFSENGGMGYGESFAVKLSGPIVDELQEKGLLKESQGAKIVEFAPVTKLPPLIVVKNDGTSIYATRDLAIDKFRLDQYGPELKIINEVGREQSLYFRQLYETERMLGWFKPGQRIHIAHGLYRFKDRKMSTRKGDVIWLNDVLAMAETKVQTMSKEVTEDDKKIIAMGAIKWNDLSREAINDIDFDLERMLDLKGNSGAYMQYTVVRIRSVLQKSENEVFEGVSLWKWWDEKHQKSLTTKLEEDKWIENEEKLLTQILDYKQALERATEKLAPHLLATYLYELAQEFNNFYSKEKIAGNLKRLSLAKAVEINLTVGLDILGIQIPSKM